MIENRNLLAGTRLVATHKKQPYVCTVEVSANGERNEFVLEDGKRFKSPSAAGTAVIGTACNGWRFWSIEGEAPAATPRPATKPKSTARVSTKTAAKATTRKPRTHKPAPTILKRHDNQADVSEGETRWVCNACLKHFIVFGNEVPEACPEGHRNDDAELNSPVDDATSTAKAEA